MAKVCSVCNKSKMSGNMISHSNRKTPKTWSANLQKVKIANKSGSVTKEYVCAKCLKGGKVARA